MKTYIYHSGSGILLAVDECIMLRLTEEDAAMVANGEDFPPEKMAEPMPPSVVPEETFITGTGQELTVHHRNQCHPPCPVHDPSDTLMSGFKLHWREDRGIFERICPHGVGHPDPDTMTYLLTQYGMDRMQAEAVHGCDGCCTEALVVTEVTG